MGKLWLAHLGAGYKDSWLPPPPHTFFRGSTKQDHALRTKTMIYAPKVLRHVFPANMFLDGDGLIMIDLIDTDSSSYFSIEAMLRMF
jgi:hypothetical protein